MRRVTVLLIAAVMLAASCSSGTTDTAATDVEASTVTTISTAPTAIVVTTTAAPTTTVAEAPATTVTAVDGLVPGMWDPVLATTKAKAAPRAAVCPEGTDPDVPGPVDQPRPGRGPWNNQAAVFDTHAGRIVYLDETGETWTFDVCENTWHQMQPFGMPYEAWTGPAERNVGELVYDADSDRTIAFGPDFVSVYNANTNEWRQRSAPSGFDLEFGWPGLGAVYDPVSGLVLAATTDGVLASYDVDADKWGEVVRIVEARQITSEGQTQQVWPPFLIGHVAEADRLAFLGFDGAPFQDGGALIDPRTGNTAPLEDPPGGVMGGFGSFRYATGGETAYTCGERGVCRLDPATLDWDCSAGSGRGAMSSAMVYDPINTRVVVINDFCCAWPGTTVSDDVWAIDFDTGEQVELLAVANTRIAE